MECETYNERHIRHIQENTITFMEKCIEIAIKNHIEKETFDKYIEKYIKNKKDEKRR